MAPLDPTCAICISAEYQTCPNHGWAIGDAPHRGSITRSLASLSLREGGGVSWKRNLLRSVPGSQTQKSGGGEKHVPKPRLTQKLHPCLQALRGLQITPSSSKCATLVIHIKVGQAGMGALEGILETNGCQPAQVTRFFHSGTSSAHARVGAIIICCWWVCIGSTPPKLPSGTVG